MVKQTIRSGLWSLGLHVVKVIAAFGLAPPDVSATCEYLG